MRQAPEAKPHPHSRRWRRLGYFMAGMLVLLLLGEVTARYGLGLGDPPLMMDDPEIEYLFQPSGTYHRFGNTVAYNAHSMRSDDFPAGKVNPDELRIMVIGDSVINGGALTDQADLATERLRRWLAEETKRPVVVGNISAGSWGPPNWLAYVQRFGLFEADVVVVVLSSHDYADVPTFEPRAGVDPRHPDRKPWLAVEEAVRRYLPRLLGASPRDLDEMPPADPPKKNICAALGALRQLLAEAQSTGATVLVAQHLELEELKKGEKPGHAAIAEVARESEVRLIQLGPAFRRSYEAGDNPYRDNIHPTATGQRIIARVLFDAILIELVETQDPAAR